MFPIASPSPDRGTKTQEWISSPAAIFSSCSLTKFSAPSSGYGQGTTVARFLIIFQLLKWCWIAGASERASGRKINRNVWSVGVFMKSIRNLVRSAGWRTPSFLAFRAPECRAPVLDKTPDDAATARGLALLAFAIVDLKRMLEITEFACGLAM